MSPANGPPVRSVLEGLDRRQKELLLAELVRDLYGGLDGVETIVDAQHEAVGYFMSLAARERYVAAALGFSSADELPPEARGPYLSPKQTLAYLESIAPSDTDAAT
jgi:hypothetical protein